jgi:hypothetical protein
MQKGSAAHHRKCGDRGLVGAETSGDVMYQRQECLVQAAICREKAQADPAHYDRWIDEAIVWLQRAIGTRGQKYAVTREAAATILKSEQY